MDMKKICHNQVEEAKKYKWNKGIRLNADPGEEAIKEWVQNHAEEYRKKYNDTYQYILNLVWHETKNKLEKRCPELTIEQLREIEKTIIDKFTEVWVREVSLNDNPHLDEI